MGDHHHHHLLEETVTAGFVEHQLSLTTDDVIKMARGVPTGFKRRFKWTCSCGWRSAWRDHDRRTWQLARAHPMSGQLQADL